MHELGIAFYLIDMVEDLGKQNNLTSVARVKLQLGEVVLFSQILNHIYEVKRNSQLMHVS